MWTDPPVRQLTPLAAEQRKQLHDLLARVIEL
jgi:hypothetical protein